MTSPCPSFDDLTGSHAAHLASCATCHALAAMAAAAAGDGPAIDPDCEEIEPLIAALPDTSLQPDDASRLERHLAGCPRCACAAATLLLGVEDGERGDETGATREARSLTRAQPSLPTSAPELPVGGDRADRTADEERAPFRPAVEPRDRRQRDKRRLVRGAAAALLAAAAALCLFILFPGKEESAEPRAARTPGAATAPAPSAATAEAPSAAQAQAPDATTALEEGAVEKGQPSTDVVTRRPFRAPQKPPASPQSPKPSVPADAPPPSAGETRRAEVPERLGRSDIKEGIEPVRPLIVRCGPEHGFDGKITVRFRIAPSGEVASAESVEEGAAARCVASRLKTARFRESKKGIIVNYPFVLRSGGDDGSASDGDRPPTRGGDPAGEPRAPGR